MTTLRRDILIYYGYKATTTLTLYRPIMFLYFLAVGLSWTQIALLEAVGSLVSVVTEVPTGYIGDRFGRRRTLIMGTSLIALGLFGIWLANTFLTLMVVYPIWSLGWNLRSGSDPAWLYDRLAVADLSDRFSEIRGRSKAITHTVGIFGAVLGGYLGTVDLAIPFLAAGLLTGIGLVGLVFLSNLDSFYEPTYPSPRESVALLSQSATKYTLRYFVIYYFVLFTGILTIVFMFAQPTIEDTATTIGYHGPIELLLGALYASISLVSAVLSYHTNLLLNYIGLKRWFIIIPGLVGLGLTGLLFIPEITLLVILLSQGISGVTQTLANQYVNDQFSEAGRATLLSLLRMIKKLTSIPIIVVAGWAADTGLSTPEILAIAGLALLCGILLFGQQTFSRFTSHSDAVNPNPNN